MGCCTAAQMVWLVLSKREIVFEYDKLDIERYLISERKKKSTVSREKVYVLCTNKGSKQNG